MDLTALKAKIINYSMSDAAAELLEVNPPLVLVAPTGVGKDAIAKEIQAISNFRRVITHTTRRMRQGEVNGRDYWFVNEPEVLALVDKQAFIEVNLVHGDTVYGSSLIAYRQAIESGHKPLMIIDVQGVQHVSRRTKKLEAVFILPPNFEEWMKRLDLRGAMSYTEKVRRLKSAKAELEEALNNHHFRLVVNRDLGTATKEILQGALNSLEQRQNRDLAQSLIDHIRHF